MPDLSQIPGVHVARGPTPQRCASIAGISPMLQTAGAKGRRHARPVGTPYLSADPAATRRERRTHRTTAENPKGGRGQRRLSPSRESLLQRLIHRVYLTRQKRSAAELIREIRSQSLKADLTPPSDSTIRRRLKALSLRSAGGAVKRLPSQADYRRDAGGCGSDGMAAKWITPLWI